MPSYAALLTPGERWKVVGYVAAAPAEERARHDRAERIWPNLLLDGFYALVAGRGGDVLHRHPAGDERALVGGAAARPGGVHVRDAGVRAADDPADRDRRRAHDAVSLEPPGRVRARARDRRQGAATCSAPFVDARIAVVLAIWVVFARAFRRASLRAGRRRRRAACAMHQRLDRLGAGFIVVFALTITLAAYDWLASLDPELVEHDVRGLRVRGHVRGRDRRRHAGDRRCSRGAQPLRAARRRRSSCTTSARCCSRSRSSGRYIWVCQYLLIWYGNIPEEVTHYLTRTQRRLAAAVRR